MSRIIHVSTTIFEIASHKPYNDSKGVVSEAFLQYKRRSFTFHLMQKANIIHSVRLLQTFEAWWCNFCTISNHNCEIKLQCLRYAQMHLFYFHLSCSKNWFLFDHVTTWHSDHLIHRKPLLTRRTTINIFESFIWRFINSVVKYFNNSYMPDCVAHVI